MIFRLLCVPSFRGKRIETWIAPRLSSAIRGNHAKLAKQFGRHTCQTMFGNGYGHTSSSRSPPPLQHPIPTHPHFIPEPPETPVTGGMEPQGYMRFSSEQQRSPADAFAHQQTPGSHHPGGAPVPGANPSGPYGLQQPPMNPYGAYTQPGVSPMGQMGAPPYGIQPGVGGPLPDMSMWGVNDATAQMGIQLGRSAVQVGQQYVQQNVSEHVGIMPGV
jgi:hypothetical protein